MTRQKKIIFVIDHILPYCENSREAVHKYLDKFTDPEINELIRVYKMSQTNQLTSKDLELMNSIFQKHADELSFNAYPLDYPMN